MEKNITMQIADFNETLKAFGFKQIDDSYKLSTTTDSYVETTYEVRLYTIDNELFVDITKESDDSDLGIAEISNVTANTHSLWHYLEREGLLTVKDKEIVKQLATRARIFEDESDLDRKQYDYIYHRMENHEIDNLQGVIKAVVEELGTYSDMSMDTIKAYTMYIKNENGIARLF